MRDIAPCQIVGEQDTGQEQKQEFEGIEDHSRAAPEVRVTLAVPCRGGKAGLHDRRYPQGAA
ncbi:hypothetical protein MACH15_01560 [Maricaulis maris]|nr:hypothetical protein MACH15_01560 [Maricaulis maris]